MGPTASLPDFNGEALSTYLTTPFLLAGDGVHVEETDPWHRTVRPGAVLRAVRGRSRRTAEFRTSSSDNSHMRRRHHYQVNIAGGFTAQRS